MKQKPLFIPLKTVHYNAFKAGIKTKEYRVFGPRWNHDTCLPGRDVILSKGYGKSDRTNGRIKSVAVKRISEIEIDVRDTLRDLYPKAFSWTEIIIIEVEIDA